MSEIRLSKITDQWPLVTIACGFALSLCWAALLVWLIAGRLITGAWALF